MSTIIYLAPSEASSHSTYSKKVETKQKSEPKGSKICFSRPNYKWASAMTTGQVLSHITAISCFVSVLGWKKCVSPPIALLRWKPCWFGSLISGNTAKGKMRHLYGLFCTSCNISHHNMIEQCYLNVVYISERDVVESWKEEWTDMGQDMD